MISPFFLHGMPDAGYGLRLDTLLVPNGSVAVLNRVSSQIGCPGVAIDEAYPGKGLRGQERAYVRDYLFGQVEQALQAGDEPVVYVSVLSYNAQGSLQLLRELKAAFGSRVRTGVGGQLVTAAPQAFLRQSYIDQVGAGDAEVVLPSMLLDRERWTVGRKIVTQSDHYAPPLYDSYLGLAERLDEAARLRLGPFTGIRELVTESVRGCSWAFARKQACKFCSLPGVAEEPVYRSFAEHFAIEQDLAERYGATWAFDVSNLWVPTLQPARLREWLQEYVTAQKQHGGPYLDRYAYLSMNAVKPETAPLIREAGVRIAYLGLDGWDKATRTAHGKAQTNTERVLQICREAGLYIRTAVVIGSGLSEANLQELPGWTDWLLRTYGDVVLTFSALTEMVVPGSDDWSEFRQIAETKGISEATNIYREFDTNGCLPMERQERLAALRIEAINPGISYEMVQEVRRQTITVAEQAEIVTLNYDSSTGKL